MSLFKKIASAGGKVLNGVAKIAAAANIPIVSTVATVVDAAIPDTKLKAMTQKVKESGTVNIAKVAETVDAAVGATASDSLKAAATKVVAGALKAAVPGATVVSPTSDTSVSDVKTASSTSLTSMLKKFWWVILILIFALVYFLMNKKTSKRRRY